METNPCCVSKAPRRWVFVGCRTTTARNACGTGIETYEWLPDGTWRHAHSNPAGENPSYLAIDLDERYLHSVHGDGSSVSSYSIEADGQLKLLGSQSTEGSNPVHLCFSPCQRWVVVANYATGSVVTMPVEGNGRLGRVTAKLQLPVAPGPHRTQQRGAHPHQVLFDPSGRWVCVPDKGCDAIHSIRFDATSGSLHRIHSMATAPGSGPRHMIFDHTGRYAWAVLELSSQVLSLSFDPETGELRAFQRSSSVPDSFTGENTGAGITIDQAGEQLYVSNRGANSICVYAIARKTGLLTSPRWRDAGGKTPRFICCASSPNLGSVLLIANEDSHNILSVDGTSLTAGSVIARTGSPVCVVFTQ